MVAGNFIITLTNTPIISRRSFKGINFIIDNHIIVTFIIFKLKIKTTNFKIKFSISRISIIQTCRGIISSNFTKSTRNIHFSFFFRQISSSSKLPYLRLFRLVFYIIIKHNANTQLGKISNTF